MRLLRTHSRSVGGTDYSKLRVVVNVGATDAEALGWKEGDELEAVTRKDGILIQSTKARRPTS